MARIRSIKPEFWASEQIMELTPLARLAFIGMWNFADDGGVHPASLKTLKAEVFPSDDITHDDVVSLVGEMIIQRLIVEFEYGGKRYWHITGWAKHQRIDKPTFRHPQPDESTPPRGVFDEPSSSPPIVLDEPSPPEGKGEESTGSKPTSDEVGSNQPTADHLPACPHQEIIKLYAKHLPELPQPRIWEGTRADNLRSRWRWVLTAKKPGGGRYATDSEGALNFFDRFFGYVARSDFLSGRNGKWQGCNLAWLVKAESFAKVIDGQYENKEAA